jgi:hypothetical protein
MALAVDADLVSARSDLRGELRPAQHLLAGQEEGRAGARQLELIEDRERPARVWAVVERQCHSARDRVADPERGAKGG